MSDIIIKYDNKVVPLSVDNHQRLLGRFTVKGKSSQRPIKVQQAFVQLVERDGDRELTFIATMGKDLGKEFDHQSGTFEIKLIVGDSVSSNAILQTATLSLTLPEVYRPFKSPLDVIVYEKKPEIVHMFRQAEKRPPKLVSATFTLLVFLPILFLPILWMRIGSNLSGYRFSLCGVIFHITIFGLYVLFWLRLNMFETLKYLSIIGSVAFLSGHRVLRYIAERSK
ncbi:Ribophorin II domain containing protein [Trichuris trichiura]|uniref:Dolichyl-diphosphooligosaccharide--protein glycosyltransferase subunit 2 n=1 Tax=Trichuris trichiura TaxID=36087 RepID=A0A077Z238_TRITR|nr:Ribophorin II domain containing protein [Trichuris trichiura]